MIILKREETVKGILIEFFFSTKLRLPGVICPPNLFQKKKKKTKKTKKKSHLDGKYKTSMWNHLTNQIVKES